MPKVSVIIPVYNVEQYIERCARSLFEQTLDDIEYLFIDDCTPDGSIEVLKQVLKEYPQRKLQVTIHRMSQNSGQAKVREWGTLMAKGDYIIHCDSDDYVDIDMYKTLYEKANEGHYDMVVCDYKTVSNGVSTNQHYPLPETEHDRIAGILTGAFPSYMWNKMVKRSFYQSPDIVWPTGNMWEDMAIMVQMMQLIKKLGYIPEPLYNYEIRCTSIIGKKDKNSILRKWNDVSSNVKLIVQHVSPKEYKDEIVVLKYKARLHLLPVISSDDEMMKLYSNSYEGLERSMLHNKYLSKRIAIKEFLITNRFSRKIILLFFPQN